jgi:hypothetical protein
MPPDQRLQRRRPCRELGRRELRRRPRRPIDEVRDPQAEGRQQAVLAGGQPARREARPVQRRPEAVARPGEVVAALGREQRRVDPAEEDEQIVGDDVGERLDVGYLAAGDARRRL